MNGWTIFFVLLGAYALVAYGLSRRQAAEAEDADPGETRALEMAGPFLLWRTQRGRDLINRIAKKRRLWTIFGDAGIVVTVLAGVLVFALLIWQVSLFFTETEQAVRNAPAPNLLIGLPGVNPLIPIWYGLFALIVALVIHEGSHGILTRVADLRLKSLGLLFFIIPIGAFVEPHEEDLERATTREKNRVFAAGPMSNIVLAIAAAVVFSSALMAAVAPAGADVGGVGVTHVIPGTAADEAGLEAGMVIIALNSQPVTNSTSFQWALNGTEAGDRVPVDALHNGEALQLTATLGDRGAYYQRENPEAYNASMDGEGFLGVQVVGMGLLVGSHDILENPLSHGLRGVGFYVSYPFLVFLYGIDVLNAPLNGLFTVTGPLASLGAGFWILANTIYWLFWINLMLGTFNALPAGPLDGGQMFKSSLREALYRWFNVDPSKVELERDGPGIPQARGIDHETQTKLDRIQVIVSRATWTLGLFILALILAPVVIPPIITTIAA